PGSGHARPGGGGPGGIRDLRRSALVGGAGGLAAQRSAAGRARVQPRRIAGRPQRADRDPGCRPARRRRGLRAPRRAAQRGVRRGRSCRMLAGEELLPRAPAPAGQRGPARGARRPPSRGAQVSAAGDPHVLSAAAALPEHYVDQETLLSAFREHWGREHFNLDRLEQLHRAVRVGGRHLALPLSRYLELESFAARNDAWIAAAADLGEKALREALLRADLRPQDLDHLYFVTVTGIATPSVDALIANRLGLRADLKRSPLFGLGCVAGAAGLARASDAVRAFPGEVAALVSVELCS